MSTNNKNIISIPGLFLGIMLCILFAACGGGGGGDGTGTPGTPRTPSTNMELSFERMIDSQNYGQNLEITPVTLPAATGGNGALTYSIDSMLPDGLTFDPTTRRLSGTPSGRGFDEETNSVTVTYTATDADGETETLMFRITVEITDPIPGFGSQMMDDLTYIEGETIEALTLPEATGGDSPLSYSLAPLPDGLMFNSVTRELSGTPTSAGASINVTYTATDDDGDTDVLTFSITVAEDTMPDFDLEMIDAQNYINGITITPETLPAATDGNGALTYSIDPQGLFGLTFDPATRRLSGTPTSAGGPTTVTYTATDEDGDIATLIFDITVAQDTRPGFSGMIDDKRYTVSRPIPTEALPEATGGNGNKTYSITPASPLGLMFDPSTRELSGTPMNIGGPTRVTYTATDEDGDTVTLTFTITVEANLRPTFGSEMIDDQNYINGVTITSETLPAATGGNGALTYSIDPQGLFGLTFNPSTRELSGTPTPPGGPTTVTYTATDADGDRISLMFSITVEADDQPSFGLSRIDNQEYTVGTAIRTITLPAATGGNGDLTYSLNPASPSGLDFNADTRVLSGTPDTNGITEVTYTATDEDGDPVSLMFTIDVALGARPSFGSTTIPNQEYHEEQAIVVWFLPTATGGDGSLTYSLAPTDDPEGSLPEGLRFNSNTLRFDGTPADTETDRNMNVHTDVTYTATDTDGDTATLTFRITLTDRQRWPNFDHIGNRLDDLRFVQGAAIEPVTFPEAQNGNPPIRYSLSPRPGGLVFDQNTRVLSGTPAFIGTTAVRYQGSDTGGEHYRLTFNIVIEADENPSFSTDTVDGQFYREGTEIAPLLFPAATGGNAPLTYYFVQTLPAGLEFNSETRMLTGTPEEAFPLTTLTYRVRDLDGDVDTATFMLQIIAEGVPSFAGQTIGDQTYIEGINRGTVTLPEADGGDAPLTYSIAPDPLPAGFTELDFDPSTRELSGAPTAVGSTVVTYRVEDADGEFDERTFTVTYRMPQNKNICSRTQLIRDRILSVIGGGATCESVSELQLARVTRLNMERRGVTSLQSGDFDDLINLRRLDFAKWVAGEGPGHIQEDDVAGLTSLPEDVFEGLSSLTFLDLGVNDITSLPEGVFRGLSKLETLWISSNELTSLPPDLFDGLSSLENLDFSVNNISSLPEGLFDGLSNLDELWMSDNNISSLSDDLFDGLSALTRLVLTGNGISTRPAICNVDGVRCDL